MIYGGKKKMKEFSMVKSMQCFSTL